MDIENNKNQANQLYKRKKYQEAAQLFQDIAAEYLSCPRQL